MFQKGESHKCIRRGCATMLHGMAQVCGPCKEKDLLCQKCGRPHGGKPGTTKLCPPCRAGSRIKKGVHPKWTPEGDEKLRQLYATYNMRELREQTKKAFPDMPSWKVKRRAQAIGLSRIGKKEPPWSPEEDAFLREKAWLSPERIRLLFSQRGWKRSLTAISIRMKRFKLRDGIDSYTATGLARAMGIDSHNIVRWIDEGKLRGERRGTTGDNHDSWHITTDAIRDFLIHHPELYSLTRIDTIGSKSWFMEIVAPPSPLPTSPTPSPSASTRTFMLAGERVTIEALADMCGRDVATLLRRIDGLGMSVEQAAFGAEDIVDEPMVTPLGLEIGRQLDTLLREHSHPSKLVRTAGVEALLAARLLKGQMPILPASLLRMAEKLGCEVRVEVVRKR